MTADPPHADEFDLPDGLADVPDADEFGAPDGLADEFGAPDAHEPGGLPDADEFGAPNGLADSPDAPGLAAADLPDADEFDAPNAHEPGGLPDADASDPSESRPHRRRRRRPWWRRHRRMLVGLGTAAGLIAVLAIVAAVRYLPLIDDVRVLRATADAAAAQATAAGLQLDRPTLDHLQAELDDASRRLDDLSSVVHSDPLVALLRALPPTRAQVQGATTIVDAAQDLARAGRDGLQVAGRYVAIREAHAADPAGSSTMANLVELMATSTTQASDAATAVHAARDALATLPTNLAGPLASAAASLQRRVDQFGPPLDAYVRADTILPGIAGWTGQRRYLVLAEDPAELRPTGGFAGTYGIVTFAGGRITSHVFQNTLSLDLKPGQPYVTPPSALKDHLLGKYPWQLADANWSPDFPTSAQDAIRLYTIESGDTNIDGVIALTTYAIDDLLTVTGPIAVPEYGTTVAAGQTTLTALQYTRQSRIAGVDRKVFLQVFANRLLDALLALPSSKWPALLTQLGVIGEQRQAMAWFKAPAEEQLVAANGWDGAVRQDPGDYVYAVDANVAPASKGNLVTVRSQSLDVQIDAVGDAHDTLRLSWNNDALGPLGAQVRSWGTSTNGVMGNWAQVLVPDRSRLQTVSGGSFSRITGPEQIGSVAGRTSFGNYLFLPPGKTQLTYAWISPYAADADAQGGTYVLTVQKQPGTIADPLSLRIAVPPGAVIVDASPDLSVVGGVATLQTTLRQDVQVFVRYRFTS